MSDTKDFSRIRAAIYGQPWAITEEWLERICLIAETRMSGSITDYMAKRKSEDDDDEKKKDPPLRFQMQNNVAIIPVAGPIFPKANICTKLSGATSLDCLKSDILLAHSMQPSAMILDTDSPGGSVSGLADFCEWLNGFCGSCGYPVMSLCNPLMASAAYMIGSQCDACYSTSGGFAGSIGVIAKIDNYDRAERNQGNDPIVLRTHELKGVGEGPMTPNQMTDMQRMMQAHFGKFKEAVTRGRPQVDLDKTATGQVWMGSPADGQPSSVEMQLVDAISTLEKLVNQYGDKNYI